MALFSLSEFRALKQKRAEIERRKLQNIDYSNLWDYIKKELRQKDTQVRVYDSCLWIFTLFGISDLPMNSVNIILKWLLW